VCEIQRLLKPDSGKLLVISCLRTPETMEHDVGSSSSGGGDKTHSSGRDGFGGGEVQCFASLKKFINKWKYLAYCEMKNPRRSVTTSGSGESDGRGPIAPQFEDICPTQYAVIQAVRNDESVSDVSDVTDNSFNDREDTTRDAIEQIITTSNPQQQQQEKASFSDQVEVEFDHTEPSMMDYDDYYRGNLTGEVEVEVAGHDAFLTFDAMATAIHLTRYEAGSTSKKEMGATDDEEEEVDKSDVGWLTQRGNFVLEVGCGSSAVGSGFHKLGYMYLGTDAIPSAIHVGSQTPTHIHTYTWCGEIAPCLMHSLCDVFMVINLHVWQSCEVL
jgi:hypothetical protein